MARPSTNDLDCLAGLLHGRRSRLAEGDRLDALCHLRDLSEFSRAVDASAESHAAAGLQRRLVEDFVLELGGILKYVEAEGADLLAWILFRFQVENLKVLVRGLASHTPRQELKEHLIPLSTERALDSAALAGAGSWAAFVALAPQRTLSQGLKRALELDPDRPRPFFLEAGLDCGYFQELLARVQRLAGEDQELVKTLVLQEVDMFHLMLVVRGRFHYDLRPESLLPWHCGGTGISRSRFAAMLAAPDPQTAAEFALGRALDVLPPKRESSEGGATVDPAALEALAWRRFLRLSNRAFRRSHMGLGAVVGYVGIRRVELANLITLSEAIRAGMTAEAIRPELISRTDRVPVYV